MKEDAKSKGHEYPHVLPLERCTGPTDLRRQESPSKEIGGIGSPWRILLEGLKGLDSRPFTGTEKDTKVTHLNDIHKAL